MGGTASELDLAELAVGRNQRQFNGSAHRTVESLREVAHFRVLNSGSIRLDNEVAGLNPRVGGCRQRLHPAHNQSTPLRRLLRIKKLIHHHANSSWFRGTE